MTSRERTAQRKLQDRFLNCPSVVWFVEQFGEDRPIGEGLPTVSQIRQFLFPDHAYLFRDFADRN